MRITVVGAGYVGLSTAVALAYTGHEVVCAERDAARLSILRARGDPLSEPGMRELLQRADVRFVPVDDAMPRSDAILLAVGTPMRHDGDADIAQLEAAAREVAAAAKDGAVVIVRSTVPVGTTDRLQASLLARQLVVSNPEFLREGRAIADTFAPERIVVGGPDAARPIVTALYEPIVSGTHIPELYREGRARPVLIWTDARSAELAKYAANGFLATKLSFVNEIANLAELVGADAHTVLRVMGLDPRIGPHHLRPGLGWGGSCFPKDTRALAAMADGRGYEFLVLGAAIEQNRRQLERLRTLVERTTPHAARIALLGLAFKAGTADTRESPALAFGRWAASSGRTVVAYDPVVRSLPDDPTIEIASDPQRACASADALVVATEWTEFARLDLPALRGVMRGDLLIDARFVVDRAAAASAGFRYRSSASYPDDFD